jgi:hypothetical protein
LLVDQFFQFEGSLECRPAVLVLVNVRHWAQNDVVEALLLEHLYLSLRVNGSVVGHDIENTVAAETFNL